MAIVEWNIIENIQVEIPDDLIIGYFADKILIKIYNSVKKLLKKLKKFLKRLDMLLV